MGEELAVSVDDTARPVGPSGNIDPALRERVPDFLVVSPPRSGSTWLFENLRRHPRVFIPAEKEMKYFSNYYDVCGVDWYLGNFAGGAGKIKGDITPSYAILPDVMLREVKRLAPEIRIVVVFRDPVERAWSHAKHQFRFKESVFAYTEDGAFEDIPDEKMFEYLENKGTIAYNDDLAILKRWMAFFPRENIFIGFFDDIEDSPREILAGTFRHIGASTDVDWPQFPLGEKINKGVGQGMPERFRRFLVSLYRRRTREFAELLSANFNMSLPDGWRYITEADVDGNERGLYERHFHENVNQDMLKEILVRETMESKHVHLIKAIHRGFRVIAFRGVCYGISWSIGDNDFLASTPCIERYMREGKVFSANTPDEVLRLIDTKTYDAIKAEVAAIKAESAAIKAENDAIKAESAAIKAESAAIKAESAAIKASRTWRWTAFLR